MAAEIAFSSWDEFKVNWLTKVAEVQEREFKKKAHPSTPFNMSKLLLFRGQRLASYTLRSSFDRVMAAHGLGRNHFIESRFNDFMNRFIDARADAGLGNGEGRYIGAGTVPDRSMLNMAAIAQHNGLPTRLLDWSRSPYVAAFFAFVSDEPPVGEAAIWCMDFGRITSEKCVRASDVTIWQSQINGNLRQAAQHGAFSLNLTNEMDLENVFLPASAFMHRDPQTEILFKLVIPRSERSRVLEDLNLMRINYLSLFPDEDGVIKYLNWQLNEKEFSDPNKKWNN
jgi:hypothetical protein